MRKLITYLILIAFVTILLKSSLFSSNRQPESFSHGTPVTSSEGPKVHFTETSWNFGKIPLNSGVSHVYWIKNVGTDTLKILKVRPG